MTHALLLVLAACGPGEAVLPSTTGDSAMPPRAAPEVTVGPLHSAAGTDDQGAPDVGVRGNGRALVVYDDGAMLRAMVLEPDDTTAPSALALAAHDGVVAAHALGFVVGLTMAGDELLAATEVSLFGDASGTVSGLSIHTPLRPAIAWLDADEPVIVATDGEQRLSCTTFGATILDLGWRMCPSITDPTRRMGRAAITPVAHGYAVAWTELADDGAVSVHLADTSGRSHRIADHHLGDESPPAVVLDGDTAVVAWRGAAGPGDPAQGWVATVPPDGPHEPLALATDRAPSLTGPWEGFAVAAWVDDSAVWLQAVDIVTGVAAGEPQQLASQPGATLSAVRVHGAEVDGGHLRFVATWVADDAVRPVVWFRGGLLTLP